MSAFVFENITSTSELVMLILDILRANLQILLPFKQNLTNLQLYDQTKALHNNASTIKLIVKGHSKGQLRQCCKFDSHFSSFSGSFPFVPPPPPSTLCAPSYRARAIT